MKPLLIQENFLDFSSASPQISHIFWEYAQAHVQELSVLCSKKSHKTNSAAKIYEVTNIGRNYFIIKLLNILTRFGYKVIPDIGIFTLKTAAKKGIKIFKLNKINYIHSIGFPFSSHLVALEIKKNTKLPWIAQFNDVWSDYSRYNSYKAIKKEKELEFLVAQNADIIIHNNIQIAKIWKKKYGENIANKIKIIPLSVNINEELIKFSTDSKKSDKIIIIHTGECYGERSALSILKSLYDFTTRFPQYSDKIELKFIGTIDKISNKFIKENKLPVEIIPFVEPQNLISFYNLADIFLAIDLDIENSLFFPSKLMMYYYYQKPILGITRPGSVLDYEMRATGNRSINFTDSEGIINYFLDAVENYGKLNNNDKNAWKKHSVKEVAKKYLSIANELLDKE